MRQTLFHFPHFLFEGWLLVGWIVFCLAIILFEVKRSGWNKEAMGYVPILVIGSLLIFFVFPTLEKSALDPADPTGKTEMLIGLPVQGWGFMVMVAVVASVSLAVVRGRQIGIESDTILSLTFWMFVAGIVGARLFYVIQYRDRFDSVGEMFAMTEGGMVVYGSVIGGLLAALVFLKKNQLSLLTYADLIAPSMVLGLALGRIGCLMNGCCYGGVCDLPIAIQFPVGSPPYMEQLNQGQLLGLKTSLADDETNMLIVDEVEKGSVADKQGVKPGERLRDIRVNVQRLRMVQENPGFDRKVRVERSDGEELSFTLASLPKWSLPVSPTQLYSAANGLIICLFLWFYFPYRFATGEVFALLLIIYPITRFLLEIIRTDEAGQFGTDLTISQWVSIGIAVAGVAMFAWIRLWSQETSPGGTSPVAS